MNKLEIPSVIIEEAMLNAISSTFISKINEHFDKLDFVGTHPLVMTTDEIERFVRVKINQFARRKINKKFRLKRGFPV